MSRQSLGHTWSPRFAIMLALASVAANECPAYAQPGSTDPPRVEITLSPGGAIFFQEDLPEPKFTNYRIGGGVTANLTWTVAFEAEVGASFGVPLELEFGVGRIDDREKPHTLDYNANLVFSMPGFSSVIPFVTGGAGALTLFRREELDINRNETYFTGNIGGGVKWLTQSRRWGARADYRFMTVRSKSDAPAFFGRTNRYSHRVYGAMILNLDRAE